MSGLQFSWGKWRYDQWLFEWRSRFAGAVTAVVVLLLSLLFRTVVWGELFGFSRPDIIDGLLATGTIALAYAALVQAVTAEQTRNAAERSLEVTEKARLENVSAQIDLQLVRLEPDEVNGTDAGIVVAPLFNESVPDRTHFGLSVRNLGPGNAWDLSVVVYTIHDNGPSEGGALPDPGFLPGMAARMPAITSLSLRANEDQLWKFRLSESTGTGRGPREPKFSFLRQFVAIASWTDGRGVGRSTRRIGFYLNSVSSALTAEELRWRAQGAAVGRSGLAVQYRRLGTEGLDKLDLGSNEELVREVEGRTGLP